MLPRLPAIALVFLQPTDVDTDADTNTESPTHTDTSADTDTVSSSCKGVLTETTAELALALTFAAARRVVEADRFMRAGKYNGWLPGLFVGAGCCPHGILGMGRMPCVKLQSICPPEERIMCLGRWLTARPLG